MPRLDPVDFLPRENLVRRDLRRIEQQLTGANSIEALVDFGVTDTPFVRRLELVREIQQKIAAHPAVRHTMSIASFFPATLPENPIALSGLFSKAAAGSSSSGLMAQEQRLWRISVRLSDAMSSAKVCKDLKELTSSESVPVKFTGIAPMLGNAQAEIFSGFWQSFAQAVLTIWLVMVVALRSPVIGIIAMIPNIMPIVIVFGAVGYAGLPVDIGMMMTGSIALGISVDCTFHFLVFFQNATKKGKTAIEACQAALEHSGRPLVESTAISTIGMLALCLSSFTPTSRFGFLMAAQMLTSLLGEMVFLPALLCIMGARGAKTKPDVVAGEQFAAKALAAGPMPERAAG
jgi:predicted RND superfamily exporter protein